VKTRKILGLVASIVTFIVALAGLVAIPATPSEAASPSQFNAGYIISDQTFFDGKSMSPAEVQSFLNSKLSSCRVGYTCLKDYVQATPAMSPETGLCGGYVASGAQSAAEIISRVGDSCGVSPKALLVLLEKEQSLVTDTWPLSTQYTRATGFGCPDTAPCDPSYGGFFYQVYNGARQLRNYGLNPLRWNYRAGVATQILFNPNRDCGSSSVLIQNRATAALYNYTPYQPNTAAINNLYGSGDACSAYGNRNFWRIFTDWFGPTTAAIGTPEATFVASARFGAVTLKGWAVDTDSVTSPVVVSAQIGSVWRSFTANTSGADLSNQYPGAGGNHYFDVSFTSPPGATTVCLYLPNTAGAGSMGFGGCQTVTVLAPPAPSGEITAARANFGSIDVTGWAVRPDDLSGLVNVAANVGSRWFQLTSGQRNDLAPLRAAGAGPNQGFTGNIPVSPGMHDVCIWASKSGGGAVMLNCRSVNVAEPQVTVGQIESVSVSGNTATITGWAVWPDSLSKEVHLALNVGASWYSLDANLSNANVAAAQPGAGSMHGFSISAPIPAGQTSFCIWASNQTGGPSVVGCRSAYSGSSLPAAVVELESVVGGADSISYSGWALWPGAPATGVRLAAEIDGKWYPVDANQPSAAATAAIPGTVGNHGFAGKISLPAGPHRVCFWLSQPTGPASFVSCTSVVVSSTGAIVSDVRNIYGTVGGVHIDGWAVATNAPSSRVRIAGNIGASWYPFDTGVPNTAAVARLPGAGPNQGFSGIIPTSPGPQRVCIWVAGSLGATLESCANVIVPATPDYVAQLQEVVGVPGGVRVSGWAVWPSTPGVAVNVSGNYGNQWTSLTRGGVSTAAQEFVLGAGPNQGFTGIIATPSGSQSVCVWASRPAGPAAVVGCRTVDVP
jgi:hypothetical protein